MHTPGSASTTAGAADSQRVLRAGIVACLAYALIGWRGLLVPSMIRSVEPSFGQNDAGMGLYFFATALAYGAGSLVGGRLVRSYGPRPVLPTAMAVMCTGLVLQGFTGAWVVFALLGVLVSLGASTADIGINSLVLDLYPRASGRALNLLHVAYGTGALVAPLALAGVVGAGIAWQVPMAVTGVAAGLAAIGLAITVPSGRFHVDEVDSGGDARPGRGPLPPFLFVMALSIGCYVAAEAGVSDWLVRYLEALPIGLASLALMLFWTGIAVGRIVFARIGARLDPLRSAAVLGPAGGVVLLVALVLPVSDLTPWFFLVVGMAYGPVFPLIVAAAGDRMPGRSATVASTLVFSAVVGATVYPPAIGFLSVTVGLQVAMVGTALLAVASGVAVWVSRRMVTPGAGRRADPATIRER